MLDMPGDANNFTFSTERSCGSPSNLAELESTRELSLRNTSVAIYTAKPEVEQLSTNIPTTGSCLLRGACVCVCVRARACVRV